MLLLAMPALAHWIRIAVFHTHVTHVVVYHICPFEAFLFFPVIPCVKLA